MKKILGNLGMRRYVKKYLPPLSATKQYAMDNAMGALTSALFAGGRGIGDIEFLRKDSLLCEIFGFGAGAPSVPTTYRMLCELAGLKEGRQTQKKRSPKRQCKSPYING